MPAYYEAMIDGYLRDRQGSRLAERTRYENRTENEPMVTEYTTIYHGHVVVDNSPDRGDEHRNSFRFRSSGPSQIFDHFLTVACYAAWGGMVGIAIIVFVKTLMKSADVLSFIAPI